MRGHRRAAEITSHFARANQSLVRRVKPSVYLVAMAREVVASQLVWNCLAAKESRFKDEREIRCIIMNIRQKFDACRRPLNGRLYVETEMPLKAQGNITEILVGPLAPLGAEAMVKELLNTQVYPETIPVVRSAVIF